VNEKTYFSKELQMRESFKNQTGRILFCSAIMVSAFSVARAEVPGLHKYEKMDASENTYISVLAKVFAGVANSTKLRGTHSKGICAKADFQIYDIAHSKIIPHSMRARLQKGFLALPGTYASRVRFANAKGAIQDDHEFDPRAISIAVDMTAGQRQDLVLQNSPIFPIPSLQDFILVVLQGNPQQAMAITALSPEEVKSHLSFIQSLVGTFPKRVNSYFTQTYWSGTAFALGESEAVKYVAKPCEQNQQIPSDPTKGPDFLQEAVANHVNGTASDKACFEIGVQVLDASVMTDSTGATHSTTEWVENAGLEWKASQLPVYAVAKITLQKNSILNSEECDDPKNAISVMKNTLAENRGIGQINRGRRAPEEASSDARDRK
jgi:catalase